MLQFQGNVTRRRHAPADPEITVTQIVHMLQFALPVVIAIATLEALVLAVVMRKSYNWRAYFASLADALGRQYVVLTFFSASLAAPAIDLAWSHRLFTVPLDTTVAVVASASR